MPMTPLLLIPYQDGSTPLHTAAIHGHVEVVKYLLSCGADLGLCTKVSHTLHWRDIWTFALGQKGLMFGLSSHHKAGKG